MGAAAAAAKIDELNLLARGLMNESSGKQEPNINGDMSGKLWKDNESGRRNCASRNWKLNNLDYLLCNCR